MWQPHSRSQLSNIWTRLLVSFLAVAATTTLSSCLETASNPLELGVIPDLQVECFTAQSNGCSQTNKIVFVGLTSNLQIDCETYLFNLPSDGFHRHFDASSSTTLIRATSLQGTISSWLGSLGESKSLLPQTSYKICGFIDLNTNERLDLNEPVGVGYLQPGNSPARLDAWSDY